MESTYGFFDQFESLSSWQMEPHHQASVAAPDTLDQQAQVPGFGDEGPSYGPGSIIN